MPHDLTDDQLAFLQSMFDLARAGVTTELTTAIDAGVPVNLTNAAGDTLLMLASYHQHVATVTALLERAADTERVNDRGQTALGSATFRQNVAIVAALLAAGADPAGGGRSALEIADFFELTDVAAMLRGTSGEPSTR